VRHMRTLRPVDQLDPFHPRPSTPQWADLLPGPEFRLHKRDCGLQFPQAPTVAHTADQVVPAEARQQVLSLLAQLMCSYRQALLVERLGRELRDE